MIRGEEQAQRARDRDEDETEKYTELEPDEDTLAYLGVESGAEIFVL